MFDDSFLFAALADAPLERRMLLLSVRNADEFAYFAEAGWRVVVAGLMAGEEIALDSVDIDAVDVPASAGPVSMVLGDLAAYAPEHLDLIAGNRPPVIKANFVSSPVDSGAFLLPDSGGRMLDAAVDLIGLLRDAGYSCWISTWFRNDVVPQIWKLDAAPDWLATRLQSAFPCNIIGFREPAWGERMAMLSDTFKHQRALLHPHRESYP